MDKVALTLPPPLQSRAEWKLKIFFPNVFSLFISFTKCTATLTVRNMHKLLFVVRKVHANHCSVTAITSFMNIPPVLKILFCEDVATTIPQCEHGLN